MLLSRRQAAAGVLAFAGAAARLSDAFAQAAASERPTDEAESEAPTEIDTGRDAFEHMLAPVTINGQGPFQFLMDTGANTSCISYDLAERLMLAGVAPARLHTVVGVRERPGVMIDRLEVGLRSRKGVRAATLPLKGVDGVLGVDWLDGQRLVLNFRDKSLTISKSTRDAARDGSVIVPARRRMGQLTIVNADLGGQPISAMIDSGSQMTIGNSPLRELVAAGNHHSGGSDVYPLITMETLAGEAFSGEMLFLPFLRLGGLQLGNVPVVHANMHVFDVWGLKDKPAIVLGMDLLNQFDCVSLDFGRSQVRFDLSAGQFTPSSPLVRPA